jgi:hypothetical protein
MFDQPEWAFHLGKESRYTRGTRAGVLAEAVKLHRISFRTLLLHFAHKGLHLKKALIGN